MYTNEHLVTYMGFIYNGYKRYWANWININTVGYIQTISDLEDSNMKVQVK